MFIEIQWPHLRISSFMGDSGRPGKLLPFAKVRPRRPRGGEQKLEGSDLQENGLRLCRANASQALAIEQLLCYQAPGIDFSSCALLIGLFFLSLCWEASLYVCHLFFLSVCWYDFLPISVVLLVVWVCFLILFGCFWYEYIRYFSVCMLLVKLFPVTFWYASVSCLHAAGLLLASVRVLHII